jgi:hypothetical protein
MAARFFLISEVGDGGLWLVDTESRSVTRYEESDLTKGGAHLPDSDLIGSLIRLRLDRNYTIVQGVSLAVAAESQSSASGHSRREVDT